MPKYVMPTLAIVTFVGMLVVAAVTFVGLSDVRADLKDVNATVAGAKAQHEKDMDRTSGDFTAVVSDVSELQSDAEDAEEKANLAQDAKERVERAIKRKRIRDLAKYSQVSEWSVGCVVATPNTLDCVGKGYLDGEESTEPYKATVDEDGSYVWRMSYGD